MSEYRIISADTHIVEPPDLFEERMDHRFRDRAPRLNVTKNEDGVNHHAWFVEGRLMAPLGSPSRPAAASTTPIPSTGSPPGRRSQGRGTSPWST